MNSYHSPLGNVCLPCSPPTSKGTITYYRMFFSCTLHNSTLSNTGLTETALLSFLRFFSLRYSSSRPVNSFQLLSSFATGSCRILSQDVVLFGYYLWKLNSPFISEIPQAQQFWFQHIQMDVYLSALPQYHLNILYVVVILWYSNIVIYKEKWLWRIFNLLS